MNDKEQQQIIGLLLYSIVIKDFSFRTSRENHTSSLAAYAASMCGIYNMAYIAFSVEPSLLSSWLPLVLIPSVAELYRKADEYIVSFYPARVDAVIKSIEDSGIFDIEDGVVSGGYDIAKKVVSNEMGLSNDYHYFEVSHISTVMAILATWYSFAPALNMSSFWATKWLCTDSQSSRQQLFDVQKQKINELNNEFKDVSNKPDDNLWNLKYDFYLQYMVATFNVEKLVQKYTRDGIDVYGNTIKNLFTAACLKIDDAYIISDDNGKELIVLFENDGAVGKLVEKFNTVLANKIGEEQANIKAGNIRTAGTFITAALEAAGIKDIPNNKVGMIGEGYGSCTVSVGGLLQNKRDLLLVCLKKHFHNGDASFNRDNLVVQGEMQKIKNWEESIATLKTAIANIDKPAPNFFKEEKAEAGEIRWGDYVFNSCDKNCKIFELKDQQGGERIFVLFDVDNVDTAELKRRFNSKNKPKIESIKSNNGYTRKITLGRNGSKKTIYGKKCDQDRRNCKLFIYDTTDPSVTKLPTPS